MIEEERVPEPETVNIDEIPLTDQLKDVHQEGNYLVAVTATGVRFRQSIPPGKILNQRDGKWVFEDMIVRETA